MLSNDDLFHIDLVLWLGKGRAIRITRIHDQNSLFLAGYWRINDHKWPQVKAVYHVSYVFPSFSYSNDARHFYDAHKPTKVNKLFGQKRKKSGNLFNLLQWLRISEKPYWLKLISLYPLDRNE